MRLGIFGATGMVGRELIKVIFDRNLAFDSLRLFASERSMGKIVRTPAGEIAIENADDADYSELDLAFFAIGGGWPKLNAPKAVEAGCYVIDNSSTFRYDDEVPLVIPEINPDAIGESKLIANPNCTTAIAAIPLWAIYKKWGINKIMISTYQATSGAGAAGMEELMRETKNYLQSQGDNSESGDPQSSRSVGHEVFQHPIPFNVIPHIDKFMENDYTKEEMKVVWETRKIFGDDSIPVSCTCVRIPIVRAHSESIVVNTKEPIDPSEFRTILSQTKGVIVKDKPNGNVYPMPLTASGKYDVEVGRIRRNLVFGDTGIEFFVCGDQILKGAALNAVQIAEVIIGRES